MSGRDVPFNILLADDSVPAQNMGKKILVDAGYSVLTVSNGLEALRKIADVQPDIAILDIFMPGYTGLEICEKLRSNVATASLPVVLTVGKLEPYRPEDGEHVHSNAVIVKPFAAAELISAVRSLIGAPQVETPAVADVAAPSEPVSAAEIAPEEERNEPPYAYGGPSPLDESASAPVIESSSSYGEVSEESDPPESLVFDPDAKATPFRAFVSDLEPSGLKSGTGFASAFADVDLGDDEPGFATASVFEDSAAAEAPVFAAALPETQTAEQAAAATAEDGHFEFEIAAAPATQPSVREFSIFDPLLEVQKDSPQNEFQPSVLESSVLEVGEVPEQLFEEFAPLPESVPEEPEEQLSEEQKARRLAFEELFNSDEPLPVEGFPVESVPQSALESTFEPALPESLPVEPESLPVHREEASNASSERFERDPMLEDDLQTIAAVPAPEPVESAFGNLQIDDLISANPHETVSIEASATPVEAPAMEVSSTEIPTVEIPAITAVDLADQTQVAPSAFVPDPSLPVINVEPFVPQTMPETLAEIAPVVPDAQPAFEPRKVDMEEPPALEAANFEAGSEVAPTEQDLTLAGSPSLAMQNETEPISAPDSAPTLEELESLELGQTHPESYESDIFRVTEPAPKLSEAEI
ncbi:MAG TPA: response regulator, partial [Candidatus Saccharimonadales bacterium]|nr:response regulator [Candidatus Saccharimonadales bacterium]